MSKTRHACLLVFLAMFWTASARAEHPILPFPVTIGGQPAVAKSATAIFAVLEKPVKADAEVVLGIEPGMIIINAFPADEKGNALSGATPAIIMNQSGTQVKLDQTLDKQPLKAGLYIANIVAAAKTARVFFTVQ